MLLPNLGPGTPQWPHTGKCPLRARQPVAFSPQLCFGAILDLQPKLHVWWGVSRIHLRLRGMKGGEGPNPAPGVTGCRRGFCSVPLLLVHHFFHLPGGGVFKKTQCLERLLMGLQTPQYSSLLRTHPCRVWAPHQKGSPSTPEKSAE